MSLKERYGIPVEFDKELASLSSWKVGGRADLFVRIQSERQCSEVIRFLRKNNVPVCLVGRGSNLLFDDHGFRGCIIQFSDELAQLKICDDRVTVGAGCWVPKVVWSVARFGMSGIEHAIGIPATFGGLIYMNGGSQRKSISSHVESVRVLDAEGNLKTLSAEECGFGYRISRFQGLDEIILEGVLKFEVFKSYRDQRAELLEILRGRRLKFPRKLPNCGSVFKSSPELYEACGPPGMVIEQLGLKGHRLGNFQVSPAHANFIVNLGGGASADVLALVRTVYRTVLEKTGFRMYPEFKYVHPTLGVMDALEML